MGWSQRVGLGGGRAKRWLQGGPRRVLPQSHFQPSGARNYSRSHCTKKEGQTPRDKTLAHGEEWRVGNAHTPEAGRRLAVGTRHPGVCRRALATGLDGNRLTRPEEEETRVWRGGKAPAGSACPHWHPEGAPGRAGLCGWLTWLTWLTWLGKVPRHWPPARDGDDDDRRAGHRGQLFPAVCGAPARPARRHGCEAGPRWNLLGEKLGNAETSIFPGPEGPGPRESFGTLARDPQGRLPSPSLPKKRPTSWAGTRGKGFMLTSSFFKLESKAQTAPSSASQKARDTLLLQAPSQVHFGVCRGHSRPVGICVFCRYANHLSAGSQGVRALTNLAAGQTALELSSAGTGPKCPTRDFQVPLSLFPSSSPAGVSTVFLLCLPNDLDIFPMTLTCKNFSLDHPAFLSLYFKSVCILCQVDV